MTKRIHRYEIPVDGNWHTLALSGGIKHVACRQPDAVEVWALDSGGPTVDRQFQVFGTGQPFPDDAQHAGTALTPPDGRLVWHLMELR